MFKKLKLWLTDRKKLIQWVLEQEETIHSQTLAADAAGYQHTVTLINYEDLIKALVIRHGGKVTVTRELLNSVNQMGITSRTNENGDTTLTITEDDNVE